MFCFFCLHLDFILFLSCYERYFVSSILVQICNLRTSWGDFIAAKFKKQFRSNSRMRQLIQSNESGYIQKGEKKKKNWKSDILVFVNDKSGWGMGGWFPLIQQLLVLLWRGPPMHQHDEPSCVLSCPRLVPAFVNCWFRSFSTKILFSLRTHFHQPATKHFSFLLDWFVDIFSSLVLVLRSC